MVLIRFFSIVDYSSKAKNTDQNNNDKKKIIGKKWAYEETLSFTLNVKQKIWICLSIFHSSVDVTVPKKICSVKLDCKRKSCYIA